MFGRFTLTAVGQVLADDASASHDTLASCNFSQVAR